MGASILLPTSVFSCHSSTALCIDSREDIDSNSTNRMAFSLHMTKVMGMHWSSLSKGAGGESGKMSVICLSESAEVLMQGLKCDITRAAAEMGLK